MSNPAGVPTEAELQAESVGPRVTEDALAKHISKVDYFVHPGSQLTICVITMLNGYTVTGESACADPANFKKDVGERFALESARKKIWPLLGYVLKEELYKQSQMGQGDTFLDRMKNERTELNTKLEKLSNFISGNVQFNELDKDDQELLLQQSDFMRMYMSILDTRIHKASS